MWKDNVKSNPLLLKTATKIYLYEDMNILWRSIVRLNRSFNINGIPTLSFSDLFNDKLNTPLVFKANKAFGCFSQLKIADVLGDVDEYNSFKIIEDDNIELHIPPLLENLLENITWESQFYLGNSFSDRYNKKFLDYLREVICFILNTPNNPNFISTYPQTQAQAQPKACPEPHYLTLNSFMDKLIQNFADIVCSNFKKHIDYEIERNNLSGLSCTPIAKPTPMSAPKVIVI